MRINIDVLKQMLRVSPYGGSVIQVEFNKDRYLRRKTSILPSALVDGLASGSLYLTNREYLVEGEGVPMIPEDIDLALSYYLQKTYWMNHGDRDDVYSARKWGSLAAGAEGAGGNPVPNPFQSFVLRKLTDAEISDHLSRIFPRDARPFSWPDMWVVAEVPDEFLPSSSNVFRLGLDALGGANVLASGGSGVVTLDGVEYEITLSRK